MDDQFMASNLWHPIHQCQRHPIMESRHHPGMTLGRRIQEARKLRGISRPELSRASGVPYPTLSGIENDDQSSTTQLPAIAYALRVNIDWLQTGKGQRDAIDSDDGMVLIRRWQQPLAAGDGSSPIEYAEANGLKFKRSSLQRKGLKTDSLAVLEANGDSMEPRIHHGDALLIDCADISPQSGRIYALEYDGGLFVKRLENFGTAQWFMVSDNSQDPKWRKPRPIDPRGNFKTIGRVRWIGSWED